MAPYKSALQLRNDELPKQPSLPQMLEGFQTSVDRKLARKRKAQGFHQSYTSRGTSETRRRTNQMVGSD